MPTVTVNGEEQDTPKSQRNLLSYLRFDLGLTGTKYGCGEGLCGACTVLVDGQPVRSCMTTVGAVAGGSITTIEGLATDERAASGSARRSSQESAMQCGYCIPGFIMASVGLLRSESTPSPATDPRGALREHLPLRDVPAHRARCRCAPPGDAAMSAQGLTIVGSPRAGASRAQSGYGRQGLRQHHAGRPDGALARGAPGRAGSPCSPARWSTARTSAPGSPSRWPTSCACRSSGRRRARRHGARRRGTWARSAASRRRASACSCERLRRRPARRCSTWLPVGSTCRAGPRRCDGGIASKADPDRKRDLRRPPRRPDDRARD